MAMKARHSMYGLIVLMQVLNWFMRVGQPLLTTVIVADLALSEAQRALLMGAYFPPYVAMQIPSALLERYTGAKALIVANLLGIVSRCHPHPPRPTPHLAHTAPWLDGRGLAGRARACSACPRRRGTPSRRWSG